MGASLLLVAVALLTWPGRAPRLPSLVRSRATPSFGIAPKSMGALAVALLFVVFAGVWTTAAASVAAATALRRHRTGRAKREREAEIKNLTTGLDVLIGELRVGAHPVSACSTAADECGGEAAGALRGAASRARLGGVAAEGISSTESSIAAELDRLAAAWRVADVHGLPLAELLDANREDVLGRRRFAARTEAALAGAKATAIVLACLPILGVLLGQMMGAQPLRTLLGGGLGGILLLVGTVLACAGLMWTDAITTRVTS